MCAHVCVSMCVRVMCVHVCVMSVHVRVWVSPRGICKSEGGGDGSDFGVSGPICLFHSSIRALFVSHVVFMLLDLVRENGPAPFS